MMRKFLSRLFLIASLIVFAFIFYLILAGFPLPDWLSALKLKSIRKPFQFFAVLFLISLVIHPNARARWEGLVRALTEIRTFWILILGYWVLFEWHEIAEYLSININFLPFEFYDYMLYYFFLGKFHFTGLLHGFYHINNAMFLVAPAWYFFQSPLVLVFAYPVILVSGAIPLYFLARHYLPNSPAPVICAFAYLNYRYLENLLQMNFTVEGFYPLFIFSLVYFAIVQRWFWYGLFLFLVLSIKEDAPFYLAVFGFLLVWMRGKRWAGFVTIIAGAVYFCAVHYGLAPWTGNDIFEGDLKNFTRSELELLPTKAHVSTLVKSFGHLLFLPVVSPFVLASLAALSPLFVRGGESFVNLQFQYSAVFIGFAFPALLDGLRRLRFLTVRWPFWHEKLFAGVLIALVLVNGGNFRTPRIHRDDLKTIALAREVPRDKILVTHGHLLPYVGYRKYNFYFQQPYEEGNPPAKSAYDHADYYLIARGVNPYPMNEDFVEKKLAGLKVRSDLELIHDDGVRFLFRKKPTGPPYSRL